MKKLPQVFIDRLLRRDVGEVAAEIEPNEPGRRAWVVFTKWLKSTDDGSKLPMYRVHRYELPIAYLENEWETDDNPPPYEHSTLLLSPSFNEAVEAALSFAPQVEQWGVRVYDHPDCPG